jgi:hypothetical protein
VLVPSYDDARAGLKAQEFDVAFVHPAHIPMAEIKAGRYKAIAWTQVFTEYTASMLMNANQPLKSMDDLKGHTVVTPDPDSITAWMVRAMFRTDKITTSDGREPSPTTVRVITTRYQDAVPFYLEYNFAQVGVTASNAVVKSWTDKGGKVLLKSRPVPIKQFIVEQDAAGRGAEDQGRADRAQGREGRPGGWTRSATGLRGPEPRDRDRRHRLAGPLAGRLPVSGKSLCCSAAKRARSRNSRNSQWLTSTRRSIARWRSRAMSPASTPGVKDLRRLRRAT